MQKEGPLITRRQALGIIGAGILAAACSDNNPPQPTRILTTRPEPIPFQTAIPSPTEFKPEPTIITAPTDRLETTAPKPTPETSSPLASQSPSPEPTERIRGFIYPGDVFYKARDSKDNVFITIDDCINPDALIQFLDLAKASEREGFPIRFTIFPRGDMVMRFPDLFKRAIDEGHELGNHTKTHPNLRPLGINKVRNQVEDSLQIFWDEVSPDLRINLLRLPFGEGTDGKRVDPQVKRVAIEQGLAIAEWSIDSSDTLFYSNNPNPATIKNIVRNMVLSGGSDIILMHANYLSSPEALRVYLTLLKSFGIKADKSLSQGIKLAPEVGAVRV